MRTLKISAQILVAIVIGAASLAAAAQQPGGMDEMIDRVVAQERLEMQALASYSPVVETYIQNFRPDKALDQVPAGDRYFLGRAVLADGVQLEPLAGPKAANLGAFGRIGSVFSPSMKYEPRVFLRMIYMDTSGFDRAHYRFDYVRREFLGDVRCIVFDVTPLESAGKGRFLGRIWVEDQDDHIVRFTGAYTSSSKTNFYFHFDSWRVNAGPNLWLPAVIYSDETRIHFALTQSVAFKAQTRLWGYNLIPAIHGAADSQTGDNTLNRMEELGLLAPRGDVDEMLQTVAANLEVAGGLAAEPEIHCRVLMTSTLEAFNVGNTIVISRGLLEALPDQAGLAAVLAHELAHIALGHGMNVPSAPLDRLPFNAKDPFLHFGFTPTPSQEAAANQKAAELLDKSPYKDQLVSSLVFFHSLDSRSKELPRLISPHLGNSALEYVSLASATAAPLSAIEKFSAQATERPLSGSVQINPWTDQLEMADANSPSLAASRAADVSLDLRSPLLYLTRAQSASPAAASGAVSAESDQDASDPADLGRQ